MILHVDESCELHTCGWTYARHDEHVRLCVKAFGDKNKSLCNEINSWMDARSDSSSSLNHQVRNLGKIIRRGCYTFLGEEECDFKTNPRAKLIAEIILQHLMLDGLLSPQDFRRFLQEGISTERKPSANHTQLFLMLFTLSAVHELLHAVAWWSFGYFAIPIPIGIPPILGITLGEAPKTFTENLVISLAPILLTIGSWIIYQVTKRRMYLNLAILNLLGMGYDVASIFF